MRSIERKKERKKGKRIKNKKKKTRWKANI